MIHNKYSYVVIFCFHVVLLHTYLGCVLGDSCAGCMRLDQETGFGCYWCPITKRFQILHFITSLPLSFVTLCHWLVSINDLSHKVATYFQPFSQIEVEYSRAYTLKEQCMDVGSFKTG